LITPCSPAAPLTGRDESRPYGVRPLPVSGEKNHHRVLPVYRVALVEQWDRNYVPLHDRCVRRAGRDESRPYGVRPLPVSGEKNHHRVLPVYRVALVEQWDRNYVPLPDRCVRRAGRDESRPYGVRPLPVSGEKNHHRVLPMYRVALVEQWDRNYVPLPDRCVRRAGRDESRPDGKES